MLCVCSVYVWCVCVWCACGVYMCACGVYVCTVRILGICLYVWFVRVCGVYTTCAVGVCGVYVPGAYVCGVC